jgi:hypothetical protein
MTVVTSLALRWQRAQQIDPASIEPFGLGWYAVGWHRTAPPIASFPSPIRHKKLHRPGMSFLARGAIRG